MIDNKHYSHLRIQYIDLEHIFNYAYTVVAIAKYVGRHHHKGHIRDLDQALYLHKERYLKNFKELQHLYRIPFEDCEDLLIIFLNQFEGSSRNVLIRQALKSLFYYEPEAFVHYVTALKKLYD